MSTQPLVHLTAHPLLDKAREIVAKTDTEIPNAPVVQMCFDKNGFILSEGNPLDSTCQERSPRLTDMPFSDAQGPYGLSPATYFYLRKVCDRLNDGHPYSPRALRCEGRDIQESFRDKTVRRRIMSRYSIGQPREKYVREGMYVKDKSLSFANREQRGSTSRQNSADKEANDRVILKYFRVHREWEVDCVMMRYLTCHRPEERFDGEYADYPQLQQHSIGVSPFVVGLYETFYHPYDTDRDGGCRYLSVLQWYPETLQGYISEHSTSTSSLEMTLPIVRSLIESVAWIHNRKICHF